MSSSSSYSSSSDSSGSSIKSMIPNPCDLYAGVFAVAAEGLLMDSSLTTALKQGIITVLVSSVSRQLNERWGNESIKGVNLEYVYAVILGGLVHKGQYMKSSLKSCVSEGFAIAFYDYFGDVLCANWDYGRNLYGPSKL